MIEAVMFWNEPNNLSHWDFQMDPGWTIFAETVKAGARAVRAERDYWRGEYLSGRWPHFRFWRMTDAEIDEQIASYTMFQATRWVDGDGKEVDPRSSFRASRDAELEAFRKTTGWKSPPPRNGDKSPPS